MSTTKNISKHLDKSVIRLFLVTFLVSGSVFAFRYMKYAPCKEVVFVINAKEYREGELIKFTDNTHNATNWQWEFGDSTEVMTNREALHIYKAPGEYEVTLTVNDICEHTETVTIDEKLFVIDSTKLPKFTIPNSIMVGDPLKVRDETINASTWEWRFGETATVNSTKKNAVYAYKESGLKTVSLIVNGDLNYITKKQINVLPLPETKTEINPISTTNRKIGDGIKYKPKEVTTKKDDGPKVVPFISDTQFTTKLVLLSQKQVSANSFSEYFCGDLNKTIIANGKSMSFLVFCEQIKGKRLRIKELALFRNKGSNCIKTITVKHNKFGIF